MGFLSVAAPTTAGARLQAFGKSGPCFGQSEQNLDENRNPWREHSQPALAGLDSANDETGRD
ncbi:hypothetical protein D3C80_876600 [compost metagenome]